jgi:hypothetical protein
MQFLELHFWHNPFFIQAHTLGSAVRSRIQYRLNANLYFFVLHQYNSVTGSQSFIQLKVELEGQIYQPVVSHNVAQLDLREKLSQT